MINSLSQMRAYFVHILPMSVLLIGGMFASAVYGASNDGPANADQVKAAFIYNFTKYIQYPAVLPQNREGGFGVCATNERVLGGALKAMESLKVREQVIRFYSVDLTVSEIVSKCHVLFLAEDQLGQSRNLLESLKSQPVLTIADSDAATAGDTNIQLLIRDNKIRFRIEPQKLLDKKLRAEAALLNLSLRD